MAINFDDIKAKAKELYTEGAKKIKQYTPESFSKEKKFVNGLVISLALMTMADEKAEIDEMLASLDILKDIQEIQDLDMTQDAIELYELHLETLTNVIGNTAKWTIAVAKLLGELAKVKEYPEYATMIENLLSYLAEVDGNVAKEEVEMQDKILSAIGKRA